MCPTQLHPETASPHPAPGSLLKPAPSSFMQHVCPSFPGSCLRDPSQSGAAGQDSTQWTFAPGSQQTARYCSPGHISTRAIVTSVSNVLRDGDSGPGMLSGPAAPCPTVHTHMPVTPPHTHTPAHTSVVFLSISRCSNETVRNVNIYVIVSDSSWQLNPGKDLSLPIQD